IGMALMEHSVVDARNGRVANANFAEYAVPVHADAPAVMDVIFVKEDDPHVNPLGVKGVGEIAMVGVAPAITNAIFHATGKRIRELPVTPDKLLGSTSEGPCERPHDFTTRRARNIRRALRLD